MSFFYCRSPYVLAARNMGFLFQLPLDQVEESYLKKFLKTHKHDSAADLLFLYELQRGNYRDATKLPPSREYSQIRNAFVENYKIVFPSKGIERAAPISVSPPHPQPTATATTTFISSPFKFQPSSISKEAPSSPLRQNPFQPLQIRF